MAVTTSVRAAPKPRDAHGLVHHSLVNGGFYQSVQPGTFADSLTGIAIPGPKAILDGTTKRSIIGFTDIPDPVQIPHYKEVLEISDSGKARKLVLKDFNAMDESPVHEAFQLALTTGIIRYIPDHKVEELYPNAWANREEKLVWKTPTIEEGRPLLELLLEAEDRGDFLGTEEAVEQTTKAQRAGERVRRLQEELDAPADVDEDIPPLPRKHKG